MLSQSLALVKRSLLFLCLSHTLGPPGRLIALHLSRAMASAENTLPSTFTVSYVTTPDEKTAKEIAHKLIANKLAACVNILPQVTSIYTWEGKVNEDSESMMIIKTTAERTEDLIKFVRENHPYSVAEVISIPIVKGNEPYLDWIRKSVPSSSPEKKNSQEEDKGESPK